jgi:hypothetical protein
LSKINAPSQASGMKEIWRCHQDSAYVRPQLTGSAALFGAIDEAKIIEILARPSLAALEQAVTKKGRSLAGDLLTADEEEPPPAG